jgi:hypothetical protein
MTIIGPSSKPHSFALFLLLYISPLFFHATVYYIILSRKCMYYITLYSLLCIIFSVVRFVPTVHVKEGMLQTHHMSVTCYVFVYARL